MRNKDAPFPNFDHVFEKTTVNVVNERIIL